METLRFLTPTHINEVRSRWGTPVFVYSEARLRTQAQAALAFTAPYGLTVRYAMKANPNRHILGILHDMGVKIDASSGFEVWRAIKAGYAAGDISLTTQELPDDFADMVRQGTLINLCSLSQVERWGKAFPGSEIGVRINPGIGSGHSAKTNVGGPTSSFGIWHEQLDDLAKLLDRYNLTVSRLHTHIGSGADPVVWDRAAHLSLNIIRHFPHASTLNLGGGFKVARTADEKSTDLTVVGQVVSSALQTFAATTGRRLHLEIEPGTFMVATIGSLVSRVQDIVSTGTHGYTFLKLDAGMSELLRPMLYGAQQPLVIVNSFPSKTQEYVVVGHCCESGDLLTPEPGNPGILAPRQLQQAAIGDTVVIESVGAYASSMNVHGYNSFPQITEVLLTTDGELRPIRRRETLDELLALEYEKTS